MLRLLTCTLLFCCLHGSASAQVFSERSAAVGINHSFKARSLTGGGAAFFDYDGDGDDDLYLTKGLSKDELYRNNGNGAFTKILADIGLGITQLYNTTAVTAGDIDNDGDRDIFVSTWEKFEGINQPIARCLLFENSGNGTFTEIGASAGITQTAFSEAAMFLDFDKDGFLDIYVMNHVESIQFTYNESGIISGYAHTCYPNFLYRNNGDLTFTEVAASLGVASTGCSIAAVATDFDMDGDLDIYIANDYGYWLQPNVLFLNDYPNGQFHDISLASGANVEAFGMGIAAGDFDQDLDIDFYITNIGRNILIENQNNVFTDITTDAGVENATVPGEGFTTGWGTAFLDVDNDGLLDLFVANGRMPAIPAYATAMSDPDKLYMNNGDKTFTDVTDLAGVGDTQYGRGMAYSDFDHDGDLDIFVVVLDEEDGKSKFYINQTVNGHHYVQFKLFGKESNRDAFGSKIWLYAGGQTFLRELYGGGDTYASQNTSTFHFGLKDIGQVDSIRIDWPNGHTDRYGPLAVDTLYVLEENVTTAVKEASHILDIQVSPNPFNTKIKLKASQYLGQPVSLKLVSMEGKTLLSRNIQLETDMDLEIGPTVPPGIYMLHISGENLWMVEKLLRM